MFYEDADLPEQITVTEDVLKNSETLIVSRGLSHLHQMREALVTHFAAEYARDEEEAFADDKDMLEARRTTEELNEDSRLKKERERAGLWQQLSGLYPSAEARMSPNERAQRIAGLLKDVERLVRFEMRTAGSRKDAKKQRTEGTDETGKGGTGRTGENGAASLSSYGRPAHTSAEVHAETSAHSEKESLTDREGRPDDDGPGVVETLLARPAANWDPLKAVCFHLGISQCKLSAYSREILGVSAQEIVDQLRMESVRAELKARLRAFAMNFCSRRTAKSTTEDTEDTEGELAEKIWTALKKSRKAPHFHRTSWADNLGFSSYARFFRACVLKFHLTPHELEMEILEEIASACEVANCDGNGGHEDHEEGRKEHEGTAGNGNDAAVVKRE